jgi:putative SOS response-associated peptidase YedK
MADGENMVMAGLWSKWKNPANGEEVLSCSVLTGAPNDAMAEIHNGMPVILDEKTGRSGWVKNPPQTTSCWALAAVPR